MPLRHELSEERRRFVVARLRELLEPCRLCPRKCSVRRLSGERGKCGGGAFAEVAWYGPHHGEEPPLSGARGAGNVFFAGCSLKCVFCQNHQISHVVDGGRLKKMGAWELSRVFLELAAQKCHVLGWVTPAHVLPWAVEALFLGDQEGLDLPLVYNSSGYERREVLELLEGVVDIYLPDLKYGPRARGEALCEVSDYQENAFEAVSEMWRQVGPLLLDGSGVARQGLIVRHLVLPGELADTQGVLRFLAQETDRKVTVSLMGQYKPPFLGLMPPLDRGLSEAEHAEAVWLLESQGFENGFLQELDARDILNPDFDRGDPF